MRFHFGRLIALACILPALVHGVTGPARASATEAPSDRVMDPEEVMAYQGPVVLTQRELDAAFSKIPEKDRLAFIRDGAKVDQLIGSLLQRKLVAADAEKAGFDRDPVIEDRVRLAAQKELAEAWLEHVVVTAEEPDFETLAREDYIANPDRYRSDEVLDISHILVSSEQRSKEEARDLANELRAELAEDPTRFDELVMEASDDPLKDSNGGRYPEMQRGQMVESFERAAFALQEPGDISQPVRTTYGYHIIRLNGRSGNEVLPFEAVKTEAMRRAEQNYLESYKRRSLQKLQGEDPIVIPDGAVEIMAKRHFGENLELAPRFEQ